MNTDFLKRLWWACSDEESGSTLSELYQRTEEARFMENAFEQVLEWKHNGRASAANLGRAHRAATAAAEQQGFINGWQLCAKFHDEPTTKGNDKMENELQIFENPQFGKIRVVEKDNEPWFVAADVCRALEHTNVSRAMERLDDDEKANLKLGLPGGETNCVNEPGLYSLVLGSRKPEAKAFKRWVTHEVIPSIRRTGGYTLQITAPQIRQLQQLQAALEEWKRLESDFSQHTVTARKAYVDTRAQRDMCRVNIQRLERLIADCIGQLSSVPQLQ